MDQPTGVHFRRLFDAVPGLYLILSPAFDIVAVNDAYLNATMTKREAITGRNLFEVFPDNPGDPTADGVSNLRASLQHVLQIKEPHTMAVQRYDIRRPDGSFEERFWSPLNTPVLDERGRVEYIIHRVEDVTNFIKMQDDAEKQKAVTVKLEQKVGEMEAEIYKRAQEIHSLNRNLQRRVDEQTTEIRNVFERITDAFLALDNSRQFTYMNRRAAALLGLEGAEVIGKKIEDVFTHDMWGDAVIEAYQSVVRTQMADAIEAQTFHNRWFSIDLYPSASGLSLFFRDISERKQTEQQLKESHEQFRNLASHLQHIREEEQKRIAREVHDELGQQITGLKMDVSWLRKKLANREEAAILDQRLVEMSGLLDTTVQTVRKIASELRPSILDDFGLISALEWQSEEFEKKFSIPVDFKSAVDELDISPSLATGLFRTYQESLTNVARHASAGHVASRLKVQDNEIVLSITDDGRGFDTEHAGQKKTLGLLGMRERVLLMDGKLDIKSVPGEGTSVTIAVPIR